MVKELWFVNEQGNVWAPWSPPRSKPVKSGGEGIESLAQIFEAPDAEGAKAFLREEYGGQIISLCTTTVDRDGEALPAIRVVLETTLPKGLLEQPTPFELMREAAWPRGCLLPAIVWTLVPLAGVALIALARWG